MTRFFDAVGDVLPAPNGQRFVANPLTMWVVTASRATVAGSDLGEMGPAPEQARLGGFYIPRDVQRVTPTTSRYS